MTFVGKIAIITGAIGILDIDAECSATIGRSLQLIKRPGRLADVIAAVFPPGLVRTSLVTGETLIVGGGFPLRP